MKIVIDEPMTGFIYNKYLNGQGTLGAAFELWVGISLDWRWWDRHNALTDWFDAR